jgi:hypothetical protein
MKKETKYLMYAFFSVLLIKLVSNFFVEGPFIFPDETCVAQVAEYFSKTFSIENCFDITNIEKSRNPMPLYSILIAPIYLFTGGIKAFYIAIALNSLLVSSLIFPIYQILKKFITSKKLPLLVASTILLFPTLFTYEKTLMTGTVFAVIGIWTLHLYLQHTETKPKDLSLKIIGLSVLATCTRPYGFILSASIFANEVIRQKKISASSIALLLINILAAIVAIRYYTSTFGNPLSHFATVNFNNEATGINLQLILIALKNQINSLTIATFFIPTFLVIRELIKPKNKAVKKIRIFIICLLALNLLISANHIYGYLEKGKDLFLLTRYINLSIVVVSTLGMGLLLEKRKEKFKYKDLGLGLLLLSFIFILGKRGKVIQNLELANFYDVITYWDAAFIPAYKTIFLVLFGCLLILFFLKKKKIIAITIILTSILVSLLNISWIGKVPHPSKLVDFFQDKEKQTISYFATPSYHSLTHGFKILSYTSNHIEYEMFPSEEVNIEEVDTSADYIITRAKLDLPIEGVIYEEELNHEITIYNNKDS